MTRQDRSPEAMAARRERITQLSKEGVPVAAIAVDVGVAVCTVIAVRKAAGLNRWTVRPFTLDEDQRIRDLLADGASYAEVARTVGRHHQVIGRRYPGHGWTMQQRDEFTRLIRAHDDSNESALTVKVMWSEKNAGASQKAIEQSKLELTEPEQAEPASLVDALRQLNRERKNGAERVVSYCEQCATNGRNPVIGVYRMWELAEEAGAKHRAITRLVAYDHAPYEYDLFEMPTFAAFDDILPALRKHIWFTEEMDE